MDLQHWFQGSLIAGGEIWRKGKKGGKEMSNVTYLAVKTKFLKQVIWQDLDFFPGTELCVL